MNAGLRGHQFVKEGAEEVLAGGLFASQYSIPDFGKTLLGAGAVILVDVPGNVRMKAEEGAKGKNAEAPGIRKMAEAGGRASCVSFMAGGDEATPRSLTFLVDRSTLLALFCGHSSRLDRPRLGAERCRPPRSAPSATVPTLPVGCSTLDSLRSHRFPPKRTKGPRRSAALPSTVSGRPFTGPAIGKPRLWRAERCGVARVLCGRGR